MSAPSALPAPAVHSARAWQVLLAALVPGSVHLLRGKLRFGALLLGYTIALAALVAIHPATFLRGLGIGVAGGARPLDLDGLVASVTVVAVLAVLVGKSVRDAVRGPAAVRPRHGVSEWSLALRQFRKSPLAVLGLNLMLVLYLVALLAPLIAPFDPDFQADIVRGGFLRPSGGHLLGTDLYSRDVFSRIVFGSRISLSIGFVAVGISVTIGTVVGAISGYLGGVWDSAIMRLIDMLLAFPRLVLLLAIVNFWKPSIFLIVAILGLTGWMGTSRIVRGQVLSLREQEFMQACRALGVSPWRTILRHLIPNTLAPVIVSATLGIGATILVEASLSFLGLGVPPPTSTWGAMVYDGKDSLTNAWWVSTFPGLAIVLAVSAFNMVGDGLRDALDPRMRTG